MTDHIVPINLGGDPWAWDNLQALCNSHHNRKSAKDKKK
jgi:5-methylcytosine-specific restriction endonuclease McrA